VARQLGFDQRQVVAHQREDFGDVERDFVLGGGVDG